MDVKQRSNLDDFVPWTQRSYLYSTHPEALTSPMESVESACQTPTQSPKLKPKQTTTPKSSSSPRKVVSPSSKQSPKKSVKSEANTAAAAAAATKASPGKQRGVPFSKEEDLIIINYYISMGRVSDVQKLLPSRASSSISDRCKKLFKSWKDAV